MKLRRQNWRFFCSSTKIVKIVGEFLAENIYFLAAVDETVFRTRRALKVQVVAEASSAGLRDVADELIKLRKR